MAKARFPARKQMGVGTTVSQSAFMSWNDQDKQWLHASLTC